VEFTHLFCYNVSQQYNRITKVHPSIYRANEVLMCLKQIIICVMHFLYSGHEFNKQRFCYCVVGYGYLMCYSELDSSSNEINDACFFKTKVWRNRTKNLIVQQIVPPNYDTIQEFFLFENHRIMSIQLHSVNLTVAGHVTSVYFLLSDAI